MISRRDLLLAGAAQSLVFGPLTALAQTRPKKTAKKRAQTAKQRTSSQTSAAAIRTDEQTNDVLAPVRDEFHLPGLIGAIQIGNRLATIGALGIRKIGSREPIQPTDQMHLGSCTKAMTATLIGMLVDDGLLTWKTTIRDVFPDEATSLHPQFQTVTLSQLLTHRAGLPQQGPWWSLPGRNGTEMRHALLLRTLADPPVSRPGTRYGYSNVGYAVAGLMAETITGESWESLLKRRLFDPLGMTTAGFGIPGHLGDVSQPWGHRFVGKDVRPIQMDNATSLGPAGTVHCSVPDWAKFAALHLGATPGSPRLLRPATLEALHTPPPGSEYAGGWLVLERSWGGGRVLNHGGSNTSFYVNIWIAPVRNFAVLVATNQGGKEAETATDRAVQALLQAFLAPT